LVGLVVPSSNPTIERFLAAAPVQDVLGIDVVVTRLAVTRIGADGESDGQFAVDPLQAAVDLLQDAETLLVVWAGTAGFWQDEERSVLDEVEQRTGGRLVSSREAMLAALADVGASATAVLTPYVSQVHDAVLATFKGEGFAITGSKSLGLSRNLDFAHVDPETIRAEVLALAGAANNAVSVVCTNMLAAVAGPPVVDSVVATLWHAARVAGATSTGYLQSYAALVDVPLPVAPTDGRDPGRLRS
jgi:maleate isomerase